MRLLFPLTGVGPVVVLHGRQAEEGVVARRPGALVRLLPAVQLHVVVQGPFFTEGAVAQVTLKLPARGAGGKAAGELGGGEAGWRGEREKKTELFTDPKADVKKKKKELKK